MNDAYSRPAGSDPSGLDVGSEGGSAEANSSSDRGGDNDPVVEFVSNVLGREFTSREEAEKSLANLNGLVGDRSIAELRSQAELGGAFESLVQGYAAENGLTYENARADLLSLTGSGDGSESNGYQQGSDDVAEIKQRLDRQDLLTQHPEARHVLDDIEAIASSRGMSLEDAYTSSRALQAAAKSFASSNDRNARGTILNPSQRIPGNPPQQRVTDAVESFKKNRTSGEAADALVATALGLR